MSASRETYCTIIREASRMGAAEIAKLLKPEQDRISKRQAEHEFSWAWIKSKMELGQIAPVRSGNSSNSTMYFSREQLVALQASERIEAVIMQTTVDGQKDIINYQKALK